MLKHLSYKNMLFAGLAGEIAFEAYAWLISPLLFGVALGPANLIVALGKLGLGVTLPYWAGFAVHFSIGVIGFSAFVMLTHFALNAVARANLVLSGAIAGLVLWFVAQGILAPVVGRSFMMGFGTYTQSSFVGHVGMSIVIAIVYQKLTGPKGAALPAGPSTA